MDDNETYMNKKPTKTDIQAPSRDYLNSTYTELNIRKVERFPNTQTDGLDPTYSQLNLLHNDLLIAKEEDPPIASRPGKMPMTAQAGAQKQEPKQNIGNRSVRKISLLCLVTIGVAMVAGLSIYVSQTRQSLITADRNYRRLWEQHQEMNRTQRQCQQHVHELNTTLESRTSENSLLDISQRTCLNSLFAMNNNLTILENNISVLNSDLSELNRTHNDLRYQFNQLEMKYRNINENKAQICQYLIRRTVAEQTCPQIWIKNEDRCYFISKIANTYDGARQHCSELDSGLLEINSNKEKNFVSNAVYQSVPYWIGKCANR
ncbi:C-type lectin domain family 10 member A-like isoform X3 [Hypanus sabinus]|uniref:C-type lectin domain family 10 member A-like isoform X3 n=1 Tax=Hypanus sabinus TaxID=79690 RepID=UPI0028C41C52|nr:C-type lectin domain family 10 member A-like isoform X3 [Hypanus sabinus]